MRYVFGVVFGIVIPAKAGIHTYALPTYGKALDSRFRGNDDVGFVQLDGGNNV